jgi:hypothetical protein
MCKGKAIDLEGKATALTEHQETHPRCTSSITSIMQVHSACIVTVTNIIQPASLDFRSNRGHKSSPEARSEAVRRRQPFVLAKHKTYINKGQGMFVRKETKEAVGWNFWGTGERSGEVVGLVRSLKGDCWSISSGSRVVKDVSGDVMWTGV